MSAGETSHTLEPVRQCEAGATWPSCPPALRPSADSVPALAMYAAHRGVPSTGWHLLTGDPAALRELANGSYFVPRTDGAPWGVESISHTETVLLLDNHLRIRTVRSASTSTVSSRTWRR